MQKTIATIVFPFMVIFLSLSTHHAYAADGDRVGTVSRLQKSAIAIQDALPRILAVGDEILIGDVISTGKGARIEVTMIDDTVMTLGERTNFVVIDLVFTDTENSAAFRLLQGAFKAATGELIKVAGSTFTVETETATIGIRGTEFWGGPLGGEFQVAMLSGKSITIENKAGRVELTLAGQGTKILSSDSSPAPPKTWGKGKVDRALATVAFD